jgi:uncharacterized protein (TIGR02594 family)
MINYERLKELVDELTDMLARNDDETIRQADEKKEKAKTSSKYTPWFEEAKRLRGLDEIPGKRSNAKIMSWAADIGGWIKNYYTNDDIPWCGLFVAHCMMASGIKNTLKNPLSARAWAKFGVKCEPCPGAVMVFSRKGGGHVGFYVSEDKTYYHILGGNQSNSVNVTKVSKKRFLAARWPKNYPTLYKRVKGRVVKKFDGKVSTNEA